ncbi:ATP-dependent metallopeptidase FtsH/Yme1/Tma family protein [Thermoanaerobacterium thermosaccharolyticum]|uniref:ATP-dependent metallopeptidase FtsH/Yme1/Tma family protein n=1 Tax=Thermoanaerobacterium thermosaccharolyticum TaxID=1517 RepID=UPI00123A7071|nr:AAA family ATPase [Thermoanaerobacterium thermosaccharolyticum]KAA5808484.1 ATP-dependent zinc metalloprotease FtsH [Thermoanaerobacterium thermosaccharolyticum]
MKKNLHIILLTLSLVINIILGISYTSKANRVFVVISMLSLFLIGYILYKNNVSEMLPVNLKNELPPKEKESNKKVSITFRDVAGLDEVIDELKIIIDFINNTEKYDRMGAKIPKGILFYGPPGTGKTLLATALAGETNSTFISASGSEFVEKYVGVGASRIRALFARAKKSTPSIIFIDEIDAVGSKRNNDNNSEKDQTLNQLLVEMDGFNSNDGIIVIGATNRLDMLDEALLRPGRFDRTIHIGNPNVKARLEILKVHTRNKPLESNISLEELAKKTHGMTGAHLSSICNEAAILAVIRHKQRIGREEFDEAIERVVAGLQKKNPEVLEKERKIAAHHEAGHAIIGKILNASTVEKISIVPRGEALGYVLNFPKDDAFLMTKTDLKNKITMLLGGRAAEEIMFNEVSTGAENDLKEATNISYQMVCNYGMSELGNRIYDIRMVKSTDKIDAEVNKIINHCYTNAKKILIEKKDKIILIAEKLLSNETITKEEIDELMNDEKQMCI